VLLFSVLWLVVVYLPICHMVWGGPGAFFADLGVRDFAGGIVGTLLLAVFGAPSLGGRIVDLDMGAQLKAQAIGAGATAIYSALATFVLLKLVSVVTDLRVTEPQEREGLDQVEHAEAGYEL